jgi:predicted phage terminase large subunit-like protein
LPPTAKASLDALLAAPRLPGYEEFLRSGMPNWTWDWPHQRILYAALREMTEGRGRRLMISMPPRHTKTHTVTVPYPVYRMLRRPDTRVIIACYNETLAKKFSRTARGLAKRVGVAISDERAAASEWETTAGGGIRAVGVGSGVTGAGANCLIIDDPVKSRAEADSPAYRDRCWTWYTEDLYTRLEPGADAVLVMTRWHEDDLAGRILASPDADEWQVINLPAIAEEDDPLGRQPGAALCPDRYDEQALADTKRVLGSYAFAALYQGRPSPPEGSLLQRAWWKTWKPGPDGGPPPCDRYLLSWDCAFKDAATSDYVVGQVWAQRGADFLLLDQVRGQMGYGATVAAIEGQAAKWPRAIDKVIEEAANGAAVIETLSRRIPGIIPVTPAGGKVSRVQAVSGAIESGNVYLPPPEVAPWVGDFIEECASFPHGHHDDQVDAMSQGLGRLLGAYHIPAAKPAATSPQRMF